MKIVASLVVLFSGLSTVTAFAAPDDPQWVPEMYNCGNQVYQFICTVKDQTNSISTCRPDKTAAAEDAWRRFDEDFGIDAQTTLTCKKFW